MLCKQLVILERALQTINDSTWRRVFIPLIPPRSGVLYKDDIGNCMKLVLLQVRGHSVNISQFHTEEGAVHTGHDGVQDGILQITHDLICRRGFRTHSKILHRGRGSSKYSDSTKKMKNLCKYPLVLHIK